jgi:hypothetical protein
MFDDPNNRCEPDVEMEEELQFYFEGSRAEAFLEELQLEIDDLNRQLQEAEEAY